MFTAMIAVAVVLAVTLKTAGLILMLPAAAIIKLLMYLVSKIKGSKNWSIIPQIYSFGNPSVLTTSGSD
jgi:hypothetical protein